MSARTDMQASESAGAAPADEDGLARRDVVDGLSWFVLGAAILIGSWRMDRLEQQGINPYTVPGLVPGLLGFAMALFALVMILRGARQGGFRRGARSNVGTLDRGRVATVIGLCVAFAAGLVGHGPPFWLAAAIFVAVAIFVLRLAEFRADGRVLQGLATAIAIGLGAGIIVTLVFERFFFVRLP